MVELTSLKCPDCGSVLDVPKNVDVFFCQYCGSKILLNNSNEKIIRRIDEAEIKKAETEQQIKLKELEMEEKRHKEANIYMIVFFLFGILLIISSIFFGN